MSTLFAFFQRYGLAAMLCIIFLEYACFPVSSEIVLPFSGIYASGSQIPFLLILPLSVAAGLAGTSLCYFAGKLGGAVFLERFQRKFPSSQKAIQKSLRFFYRHGNYAICFGRVIPICRTYIALAAGFCKMPYGSFLLYSLVGITIWNTILIGAGYFFGANFGAIQALYQQYKIFFLFLIGIFFIIFLFKTIRKRL